MLPWHALRGATRHPERIDILEHAARCSATRRYAELFANRDCLQRSPNREAGTKSGLEALDRTQDPEESPLQKQPDVQRRSDGALRRDVLGNPLGNGKTCWNLNGTYTNCRRSFARRPTNHGHK